MSDLGRLLDPTSIAIVGLSADLAKHGGRVFGHLRSLGFTGTIYGVNPGLPVVDGVEVFARVPELPRPPDLVVCAIPAASVLDVVVDSEGAGGLVVFAGGFGESGSDGQAIEAELMMRAGSLGVRVLGPNSGGVIRPSRGLAASFLTCLDRPSEQIRTGPVGVVTQSGGTGSYIHNLAAARGSGLAISVSTGNEIDIKLGEAIDAVSRLDEVKVVLALIETVRDGLVFIESIRAALALGKPVVACRIGTGSQGKRLMTTHTGAMAVPEKVLEGVLYSLGVVIAETPGEAYEVAELLARSAKPTGDRVAIVTHSGGIAIHLADLAERNGVDLPAPDPDLRARLDPLLDHGAANNPLDMGGVIGGPGRFAEIVKAFTDSGEYDLVLAVSTAHPPTHTAERVHALLSLAQAVPIVHLWMAGDQAIEGLRALWASGGAVTEEPRAAIRALAGLAGLSRESQVGDIGPITGDFKNWGLPLVEGGEVADADGAVAMAERLGYPVVVKVISPGLAHKTEAGGVALDLGTPEAVATAFKVVTESATAASLAVEGARVERYRPGIEVIVGGTTDPVFGKLVSVGLGGVLTELVDDVVFVPAPIGVGRARVLIDRLRSRKLLDGFRDSPAANVETLAEIVSLVSRGFAGSQLQELEVNPLVWTGQDWVAVDWIAMKNSD